jgi:hypothetical protein
VRVEALGHPRHPGAVGEHGAGSIAHLVPGGDRVNQYRLFDGEQFRIVAVAVLGSTR